MLKCPVDDSGTHKGAEILCLCGFVAEGNIWDKFDDSWRNVLEKQWPSPIDHFHGYDCAHGHGQFENWSFAERLALFGDLVGVVLQFDLRAIGAAVIPSRMGLLAPSDFSVLSENKMETPLKFTFHLLMQQLTRRSSEWWPSEEVAVIFENCDRDVEDCFRDLYIDYRDGFYLGGKLRRSPSFEDKNFTPLQASDLLAYSTYQIAMKRYFPRDAEPYFDVAPGFQRMLDGIMHDGGIYDDAAFGALLNRIRSGDPSLIGNKKLRKEAGLLE